MANVLSNKLETLALELEESKELAKAKERLLLIHIDEMEILYGKLNEQVEELNRKNKQLRESFLRTIESLAISVEAKDYYTNGHSKRVAYYCKIMASEMGLSTQEKEELELAGLVHDIGKIGISEKVLQKPSKLSDEEYNHIKEHPLVGAKILQPLEGVNNIICWIKHHHERFDGRGYPSGLTGDQIPLGAKIIACADTYDAMTTDRPYREALAPEHALEEIKKSCGSQLDPEIGLTFFKLGIYGKLNVEKRIMD
ncbi:MAG: HD-GYP domain-containing protein [Clostridia bacterium]|jgi:putative nucleotidyltransferase with HDIG domain|nr:HD-GYP domain-containing protein [Clostridia bacterium]